LLTFAVAPRYAAAVHVIRVQGSRNWAVVKDYVRAGARIGERSYFWAQSAAEIDREFAVAEGEPIGQLTSPRPGCLDRNGRSDGRHVHSSSASFVSAVPPIPK
jgi:hypothetical protein